MLYLNIVTQKIQHHSTTSFIFGEDHLMQKLVLGHNGVHSSDNLQGSVPNAMVMSQVSRVYQWLHKSYQVSPCQSALASGPLGRLLPMLEQMLLLGSSQPTQELHAEPLLHHRMALDSDWGMGTHNGPGLLQSYKVLFLCPEMLAPVRIWRRKKTRFFVSFFF